VLIFAARTGRPMTAGEHLREVELSRCVLVARPCSVVSSHLLAVCIRSRPAGVGGATLTTRPSPFRPRPALDRGAFVTRAAAAARTRVGVRDGRGPLLLLLMLMVGVILPGLPFFKFINFHTVDWFDSKLPSRSLTCSYRGPAVVVSAGSSCS
jgi:hypothetical protein